MSDTEKSDHEDKTLAKKLRRARLSEELKDEVCKMEEHLKQEDCKEQGVLTPSGPSTNEWVYRATDPNVNRQHACRECNDLLCKSEMLIEAYYHDGREDPLHDPHGIPGRCFQCASGHGPWGPDHAIQDLVKQKDLQQALQRFHVISKRKWNARAKAAKDQLTELRGSEVSQIMNLVEARMTRQMKERGEERKITKRQLKREAKAWFKDTAADVKKQIKEQMNKKQQDRAAQLARADRLQADAQGLCRSAPVPPWQQHHHHQHRHHHHHHHHQ